MSFRLVTQGHIWERTPQSGVINVPPQSQVSPSKITCIYWWVKRWRLLQSDPILHRLLSEILFHFVCGIYQAVSPKGFLTHCPPLFFLNLYTSPGFQEQIQEKTQSFQYVQLFSKMIRYYLFKFSDLFKCLELKFLVVKDKNACKGPSFGSIHWIFYWANDIYNLFKWYPV